MPNQDRIINLRETMGQLSGYSLMRHGELGLGDLTLSNLLFEALLDVVEMADRVRNADEAELHANADAEREYAWELLGESLDRLRTSLNVRGES